MAARWLTSPGAEAPDAEVHQNARSDRQTLLAVGSHRACEANFRIGHVGNAFRKRDSKKTIGDVRSCSAGGAGRVVHNAEGGFGVS